MPAHRGSHNACEQAFEENPRRLYSASELRDDARNGHERAAKSDKRVDADVEQWMVLSGGPMELCRG